MPGLRLLRGQTLLEHLLAMQIGRNHLSPGSISLTEAEDGCLPKAEGRIDCLWADLQPSCCQARSLFSTCMFKGEDVPQAVRNATSLLPLPPIPALLSHIARRSS